MVRVKTIADFGMGNADLKAFCRVVFLFLAVSVFPASLQAEAIGVYAAASLTNALQDIVEEFEGEGDVEVKLSFAGSSTLARQIAQGAPADVYLSANPVWMDYLEDRELVEPESRIDLLGNVLVVVAPKGEGFRVRPRKGFDFSGVFEGRLALADPSHVPAGMYAKQALEWLGWWEDVKGRLAVGHDVRTALVYVERGACPVGVVYATDAAVSSKVEVLARLPGESHDPIVYAVAIVKGRRNERTVRFMKALRSDTSSTIFQRYGFAVLKPEASEP